MVSLQFNIFAFCKIGMLPVLVVYDREYPAPTELKQSWERFQKGSRPTPDKSVFFD